MNPVLLMYLVGVLITTLALIRFRRLQYSDFRFYLESLGATNKAQAFIIFIGNVFLWPLFLLYTLVNGAASWIYPEDEDKN